MRLLAAKAERFADLQSGERAEATVGARLQQESIVRGCQVREEAGTGLRSSSRRLPAGLTI